MLTMNELYRTYEIHLLSQEMESVKSIIFVVILAPSPNHNSHSSLQDISNV